jgi:hypothetical protein
MPTQTPTATNTFLPPSSTPTASAGATGWHAPSADIPGNAGDRNGFEADPANAYGDDGLFAADIDSGSNTQFSCNATREESHQFYNFDFSIPSGATITGIEARLDGWADSTTDSPRFCVQFSWNNGSRWSEFRAATITATSEDTYLFGAPGQIWGRNWSPDEFNNGNFRMRVIMDAVTTDRDFFLDWAAVQIHYR